MNNQNQRKFTKKNIVILFPVYFPVIHYILPLKRKLEIIMDAMTERIYNHLKSFVEENGFSKSIKQISKDLNIPEHEVQESFDKLQQFGRIRIITTSQQTNIEFCE